MRQLWSKDQAWPFLAHLLLVHTEILVCSTHFLHNCDVSHGIIQQRLSLSVEPALCHWNFVPPNYKLSNTLDLLKYHVPGVSLWKCKANECNPVWVDCGFDSSLGTAWPYYAQMIIRYWYDFRSASHNYILSCHSLQDNGPASSGGFWLTLIFFSGENINKWWLVF